MRNQIMKCIQFPILISVLIFVLISIESPARGQTRIEITTPMTPPAWALMECQLLEENERFVEVFADKYVHPTTGHLKCVEHWGGADGADDAMENFNNWPLLYAFGADESTLDLVEFIWNGHIDQYSQAKNPIDGQPMYYKEFITAFDWEHTGEGLAAFFLLPLSDPEDQQTKDRITRFANFYTGRDATTDNYDPDHKIIRSFHNGSKGAKLEVTNQYFFSSREEWLRHKRNKNMRFHKAATSADHINVKGDVPFNLVTTSLAVNAYLSTGDEHYKDWVLEYVGAWRKRARENGGNIPSHVGLNGIIGEHWDGRWYGGMYGWNYGGINGFNTVSRGVRIGYGNAYFLSGDSGFIEALRVQGDNILKEGRKTANGMVFPNRYGDDGWHEYSARPGGQRFIDYFADLYIWTLEEQDLERLYKASQGEGAPWIEYLQGKNPDYPVEALSSEFEILRNRIVKIRNDASTADTRRSDSTQSFSRAATHALVNLTMGGLQPMTYGGLLYCQLRYFDKTRQRPGLPEDVAALISEIDNDKTTVTLVNINQAESREVIIQGGAYGEHNFVSVDQKGNVTPIDSKCLTVKLAPGAGSTLTIKTQRLANTPTLAFPWN